MTAAQRRSYSFTRLLKFGHLRRSALTSKSRLCCPTFVKSFFVTRGTIGRAAATELHNLLDSLGVSVCLVKRSWPRNAAASRIDRGLAKLRIGVVLVTPTLLRRLQGGGIADKVLSALLARDQPVPVVHGTTYDDLREVSPLLGSRTGLSTSEASMKDVAVKLAELIAVHVS